MLSSNVCERKDYIDKFLIRLKQISIKCDEIFKNFIPIENIPQDIRQKHESETHCFIYKQPFIENEKDEDCFLNKKVFEQCHLTGKYNLNYEFQNFIIKH